MQHSKHRKLNLIGKITVIKTFAFPKLIYPFSTLQHPPKETIQLLTKAMFDFFRTPNPTKLTGKRLNRFLVMED